MTPAARVQAAIELLDEIIIAAQNDGAAADTILARGFKARRYAGSGDRRAIREHVYEAIRAFANPPVSGRAAFAGLAHTDQGLAARFDGSPHGPAALDPDERAVLRTDCPDWLADMRPDWLSDDELQSMRSRAPLDLRVNGLKAEPGEIAQALAATPLPGLRNGLRLDGDDARDIDDLVAAGSIEVQDAGSQWISELCGAQSGQLVVDLCAGAGGKTLALADDMENQGRLIAADTDRTRLSRLVPRAERAGVSIIESILLNPRREMEALSVLSGQADIVLVDAPCSGTGTWRRNPEARWRISAQRLGRFSQLQAHVLDLGAQMVKPGGVLVYAVCSFLEVEGRDQIDAFLARHQGWKSQSLAGVGRPNGNGLILTPRHDGTDGFFVARLERTC